MSFLIPNKIQEKTITQGGSTIPPARKPTKSTAENKLKQSTKAPTLHPQTPQKRKKKKEQQPKTPVELLPQVMIIIIIINPPLLSLYSPVFTLEYPPLACFPFPFSNSPCITPLFISSLLQLWRRSALPNTGLMGVCTLSEEMVLLGEVGA